MRDERPGEAATEKQKEAHYDRAKRYTLRKLRAIDLEEEERKAAALKGWNTLSEAECLITGWEAHCARCRLISTW